VLIPGAVFTYFLLRETVFKLEYGVLAELNVSFVVALLLFSASLLKSRLFLEQADQVFLIQHPAFASLKQGGYWYSFCFSVVLMAFGMVGCYVIFEVLDLWHRNWMRLLVKLVVMLLLTITVMKPSIWVLSLIVVIIALVLVFIEHKLLRQHRYFHQQLELDMNRAGRFFALLFQANKDMQMAKINYFKRKSPKVFAKLYAKQPQSTLVELLLKSIWRNKSYLRLLVQLVVILLPLIIFLPVWMSVVLIIFGYFGLRTFINAIALEAKESPIFQLIRYPDADWILAMKKAQRNVAWPVAGFYVVVVMVKMIIVG